METLWPNGTKRPIKRLLSAAVTKSNKPDWIPAKPKKQTEELVQATNSYQKRSSTNEQFEERERERDLFADFLAYPWSRDSFAINSRFVLGRFERLKIVVLNCVTQLMSARQAD